MTRRTAAVAVLISALLTGCDTSQYLFKVDDRIEIVSPDNREVVELPVTITWTDEEPPAGARVDVTDASAQYYAVFLDRSPLRPGADLASLAEDSKSCRQTPGCPSDDVLRDRGVFLTASPTVTIEFLKDLRTGAKRGDDPHEVTLVRMRGARRHTEAAYRVSFFVRRPR